MEGNKWFKMCLNKQGFTKGNVYLFYKSYHVYVTKGDLGTEERFLTEEFYRSFAPATTQEISYQLGCKDNKETGCYLTERKMIAAMAMQGILASSGSEEGFLAPDSEVLAIQSLLYADSLIKAFNAE